MTRQAENNKLYYSPIGPVIGPLVIAGVRISEEKKQNLINIGVKDSKLLSPLQRERLYDSVIEIADDYRIEIISPKIIDEALESETTNLNWLEADYSAKIINELAPEKSILDLPSNNAIAYTDYVKGKLKVKTELVAEHKADMNYPVVSAASILAKVTRDAEIEKIKKTVKQNFGSGYPSDPLTQAFLKSHYKEFPDIFRKTWASYKKVAESKKQRNLVDF